MPSTTTTRHSRSGRFSSRPTIPFETVSHLGFRLRRRSTFAYRQLLNDQVFDDANTEALKIMTHDYGVRYLFVDALLGSQNPAVLQLGHVVFSNEDATIIAVG